MRFFRFLTGKADESQPVSATLLPAHYDFWQGDLDLITVQNVDLDRRLRSFFERFAASPEHERKRMREELVKKHSTELKWHPLRCSVLALRANDPGWLTSGLTAVAATDSKQLPAIFSGDTLAVLFHAGSRIAPGEIFLQFQAAAAISDKPRADLLQDFLCLPPETKAARFRAYEAEIETEDGVGFILAGGPSYRPTYDLSRLILRVRSLVAGDRYEPQVVSLGGSMGDRYLRKYSSGAEPVPLIERGTDLADALGRIRGTASVYALLRPAHDPSYDKHSLLIHLIECCDAETQQFLSSRLNDNHTLQALLQLSAGPLLCTVSARSIGSAQYETPGTLVRFLKPLSEILDSAQASQSRAQERVDL